MLSFLMIFGVFHIIIGEGRCFVLKNKTFFQKVRCAIVGLYSAFKSEKSFTYYFGIYIFTLLINIILGLPFLYLIFNTICACLVFAAECLNTAIEKICDYLTKEYSAQIKYIKDVAASGVLCCGFVYFIVEFLLIYMGVFA